MADADRPDDDTQPEGEPAAGDTAWASLVEQLSAHSAKASRYKLEGEIARGGMGAIVKVWDKDLRRHLAMKVVLGKAAPGEQGSTPTLDDRTLGRFLEEAQVTGQLDHPGVVPVHELGIDEEGLVYFTMRLVKGRDLKAIFGKVREGKEGWTQTRALGVLLKACEALAYAHSKGVIHRDLKPANIMVGRFGEVYVMDWGLARVAGRPDRKNIRLQADGLTSVGSLKTLRRDMAEETPDSPLVTMDGDVVGTPAYMPPEQARGDVDQVGARSDVYAMGAILYELLTGQMPYVPPGEKRTQRTILAAVLEGPPRAVRDLSRGVSRGLEAICEKAMARLPEDRYANVDELSTDLRACLEGRAVRALRQPALSTLAVVAVLVPMAWLLIDLVLDRAADHQIGMHNVRLVAVGLAAIALAWPLSLLGMRLSRGRRWAVAAGWAAALSLGAFGSWRIVEQKGGQIHRAEREVLAHTVDFEALGAQREVDDLTAFATTWQDRLEAEDFLLLGRAYLQRLRPLQAEDWAHRLEAARAESPVSHALMLAVSDALGDDERVAQAAERLWQPPSPIQGWWDWNRAGDVLSDVHRYDDALRAYTVASKRPDSDQGRDALNLKLAQVSAGLCEYKDADLYLGPYIKWNEDDARAHEVAIKIASSTGDWKRANEHLNALEAGQRDTWATFVRNRAEVLRDQGLIDEAQTFVAEVAKHKFTDFNVLDWCATWAYEGNRFDAAATIWMRMIQLKPDSAVPHIGLSSVYCQQARAAAMQSDHEAAIQLVRQSIDEAVRAIEFDPLFSDPYVCLEESRLLMLSLEKGQGDYTVSDFAALLEPIRTALRYDGWQPRALNNAAWIISQMVKLDSSSGSIEEAATLIRRAMRVIERGRAGACELSGDRLAELAAFYDTLREVEELRGNPVAALQAARSALEALPPDEQARRDAYGKAVERLEAQVSGR